MINTTGFMPDDRVMLVDKSQPGAKDNKMLREGMVGTVSFEPRNILLDDWVSVVWDDDVGGHSCTDTAPMGHGWRVHKNSLKIVDLMTLPTVSDSDLLSLLG